MTQSKEEVPGPVLVASRPSRKASQAIRKLLQEICLDESGGNWYEEPGLTTAVEESQAEAGFADDNGGDDEDPYNEMDAVDAPEIEEI